MDLDNEELEATRSSGINSIEEAIKRCKELIKPVHINWIGGMNQNAIVTVSSNSEDDILIYWQKSIDNKYGNKIEIEERRIKKGEDNILKIDEILILYTILRLYNYPIIEKI